MESWHSMDEVEKWRVGEVDVKLVMRQRSEEKEETEAIGASLFAVRASSVSCSVRRNEC